MPPVSGTPAAQHLTGHPWRWLAFGVAVAVLAAIAVVARDQVGEARDTLAQLRWGWVVPAVVLQLASVGGLAWQQASLVRAAGGRVGPGSILATTMAGDAISTGLPFAGPAAAAVFTWRRLHAAGNDSSVVAWALATSGIVATVSLALVVAVGAAVTGSAWGAVGAALATGSAVLPALAVVAAMHRPSARATMLRVLERLASWSGRHLHHLPVRRWTDSLGGLVLVFGRVRLPPGQGIAVLGAATATWLATVGCLATSVLAVGGDVPWTALLLIWSAGTGASYVGLTPGGLGVVEAALTAGLVAAGLSGGVALAAVVVYRATTLWGVWVVGGSVLAVLSLRGRRAVPGC